MRFLRVLMIIVIGFAFSMVAVPHPHASADLPLLVNPHLTMRQTPEPITAAFAKPTGKMEPYALMSSAETPTSKLMLQPVSLGTGEIMEGYTPIDMGKYYIHALSPDGVTLAAMVYPNNMSPRGGTLHLINLEHWTDTVAPLVLDEWTGTITWNADGTQLAISAYNDPLATSSLTLYDIEQEEVIAYSDLEIESNLFFPNLIRYTPNGDALILYGQTTQSYLFQGAYALMINSTTLEIEWQAELEGVIHGQTEAMDEESNIQRYFHWQPALAYTPDANKLYIVHADSDALTTVDFHNRSVTTTLPEQTRLNQFLSATAGVAQAKSTDGTTKQAVLSADGSRLYVVGQTHTMEIHDQDEWEVIRTPLHLQVIETATGRIVDTYETDATTIRLSPDRHQLYLYGGYENNTPWTEILRVDNLEPIHLIKGEEVFPVRPLHHEEMLLGSFVFFGEMDVESRLSVIAPQSYEVLGQFMFDGYATWLI